MRPSEFRVWDKKQKFFSSDDYYINKSGDVYLKDGYEDDWGNYSDKLMLDSEIEISRSTGHFDKYGKQIFCGDVLRFRNYNAPEFKAVVEYIEGCGFIIVPIRSFVINNKLFDVINQYEFVDYVGNKYENPELMEATK